MYNDPMQQNSLKKELLEIVELTELYLFTELKKKSGFIKSTRVAPLEHITDEPVKKNAEEKPLPIVPVRSESPPLPPPPKPADVHEMLSLLKTTCPRLTLIEKTPESLTRLAIITYEESDAEKKLLTSIKEALSKKGHFVTLFNLLETPSPKADFFIGSKKSLETLAPLDCFAIQSLQELIDEPKKRVQVWENLLKALPSC